MNRPRFEVADVLRSHGDAFMKTHPQSPHVCSAINLIRPLQQNLWVDSGSGNPPIV